MVHGDAGHRPEQPDPADTRTALPHSLGLLYSAFTYYTVGVTGIFLAKLDGTARGGIVVAIRDALEVPVKLVGVGEQVEDVQPFDANGFIDAMFESTSESATEP